MKVIHFFQLKYFVKKDVKNDYYYLKLKKISNTFIIILTAIFF